MSETPNMPNYEEVVGLSNGQLVKCMQTLNDQINQARTRGKSTDQLARSYRAYEDEWLKRVGLGGRKSN
ncbi:MAG: hypothetical protein H0X30_03795 [Anaerolineae bacterium]|nr:hypothetical protein [Anaerolineae bacterium]